MFNKFRLLDEQFEELLRLANLMKCGKPKIQAFVIDDMIYVLGSIAKNLDVKSSTSFGVYNVIWDMWSVLPNPSIGNVETR
nr:hypothetical protein CFP56_79664 [Quercus suber]